MTLQFMPIPTIPNGDCLFAAYAIAAGIKGKPEWGPEGSFPMWQLMSAIKLRQKTTEFMRRSNEYTKWVLQGNHIQDFRFSVDDHAAIMGALERLKSRNGVSYENVRSSYDVVRYDAPPPIGDPKRIILAYSIVMGLQGIWAGNLELKALAMLFRRDIYVKTVGRGLNQSQVVTITNRNNDMLTFDPDVGMKKFPRKGPVVYMLYDGTYEMRGTHYTALRPIAQSASHPDLPINNNNNNTRGNARRNNGRSNNVSRNNGKANVNNQRRRNAVNGILRQQQQQQYQQQQQQYQQQQYQQNGNGGNGVGSMTAMYVIIGAVSVLLSSIRAAF